MSYTFVVSKSDGQRERFDQAARELGVELDEEKLKDALRRIAPDKPEPRSPNGDQPSDKSSIASS